MNAASSRDTTDATHAADGEDLWRLSAAQLAMLIARREISATEAAHAALARLDAVNPRLNAVIDCRPDAVLRRAADIDAALARGESLGPLAGVPVTVKVNIDQAGFATTNGLTLQKDLIAQHNSPVVDNLEKAGAVILGRTNTPAFSYRWFTSNRLHGRTLNARNAALTPGGSSGGAASAVAAGIGHIAHGTDIAGSIRYPAYACGVHGLRPTPGRVAAFNASSPERTIGPQITAVSGPIARHVGDLRLALAAMSAPDARDPWWVPAPLVGPDAPRAVALCLRPDGMDTQPDVVAALHDAAERLRDAGYTVDELDGLPPLEAACADQVALWMGDGYAAQLAAAEQEGDAGALTALAGQRAIAGGIATAADLSAVLVRRAALVRQWAVFLAGRYPLVLMPVCAALPFPAEHDLDGPEAYARVWTAQMTMIAIPFIGLPALTVSTGMVGPQGDVPVGVQLVAGRFREDLVLAAGEAIEARGAPPMPVIV